MNLPAQRSFYLSALTSLILFSLVLPGVTQDWAEPYIADKDAGLLRGELETLFRQQLQNCNIQRFTIKKGKDDKELSAVPIDLQQHMQYFDSPVLRRDGSPGAYFAHVYEQQETLRDHYPDLSARMIASVDYVQDPLSMLPTYLSSVFFNESCSSVVGAAASVSGGIQIPVVSLQAALKAAYSNDTKHVLSIHGGQFYSPLQRLYDSADPSDQIFRRLLVWNLYAAHPELGRVNTN
jgi:hypothetical protein